MQSSAVGAWLVAVPKRHPPIPLRETKSRNVLDLCTPMDGRIASEAVAVEAHPDSAGGREVVDHAGLLLSSRHGRAR